MQIRQLVVLMACIPAALPAQPQCSLANLVGTWSLVALETSVQTMGPAAGQTLPLVGLAILTIDYSGKMGGLGTVVSGGTVFDYSLAGGSVEITPDCSGVMRYTAQIRGLGSVAYIERFILDPSRLELVSISVYSQASKPMWVATAKRVSPVPKEQPEWPTLTLPTP